MGDKYEAPATNRHGPREYPAWRDPARSKENWAYCRRVIGRYFVLIMLPLLLMLWGAGYGQGYLAGYREAVAEMISNKESTK